jgi:site-specific recombinase XerD
MITVGEGLQAYRIYAQAAGRSPRTIDWVTRSVRYFMEFLGDSCKYCEQMTTNDLRRFIIEYGKRQKYENHTYNAEQNELIAPISVQTYVRGIKSFFSYLATDELIPANVMLKVKTPRVPVKAVPTFSQNEVERLLRAPNRQTRTGFRDYALILTFIDTNARLSELCNLDEKDVDIEGGYLRLMGKGGKER